MRAGRLRVLAALVVAAGLVGCSGGDAGSSPSDSLTTSAPLSGECPASADQPLVVDQIAPAIVAVEAELGGPQEYFEVNATDVVVNLFVAGTAADGSSTVTPYAFGFGELTAQPAIPADGNRFAGAAVQIDLDLHGNGNVRRAPAIRGATMRCGGSGWRAGCVQLAGGGHSPA